MTASIQLPDEIDNLLSEFATRTGRSRSDLVTEALAEYLADLEDIQIAEQRLLDIREGRSSTVPLEEVMKRYGLED